LQWTVQGFFEENGLRISDLSTYSIRRRYSKNSQPYRSSKVRVDLLEIDESFVHVDVYEPDF
jgi:hypothetical protein